MTADQPRPNRSRILLLAEDARLAATILQALEAAGYEVLREADLAKATLGAAAEGVDLLIINLADWPKPGWWACVEWALAQGEVRLLAITARWEPFAQEPDVTAGCGYLSQEMLTAHLVPTVQKLLKTQPTQPFRARLLWQQTVPLAASPAERDWGLNE